MDCKLIDPDLTSFHFGGATDLSREQLEAHLQVCARCLAAYFALKRAVEEPPESARPSLAAQARLREAVARELGRDRPRTWLWGGAAAAVVVAAALLGFFTHKDASPQPLLPPNSSPQNVDSARPEALNLDFI